MRAIPETIKISLVQLLIISADSFVNTIMPPFLRHSSFSYGALGFVMAMYGIVSLASRIPSGHFSQQIGPYRIMVCSLLLSSVSVAGYGLAPNTSWIVALRAVQGISHGLSTTINFFQLIKAISNEGRAGRAMGIYSAFQSGGYAVGNFLGGATADFWGYQRAFMVASVFHIMALLFLTGGRGSEKGTTKFKNEHSSAPAGAGAGWRSAWACLKSGGITVQTMLAFSVNFLYRMISDFFPLYGLSVGLSLSSIGVAKGVNSAVGIITRPLVGELTRFLKYDTITNIGIILGAVMISIIPSFSSFWPLAFILIMAGIIRGAITVTNSVAFVHAAEEVPEGQGVAVGIFNSGKDVGNILGPIIGGLLAGQIGLANMFRVGPSFVIFIYLLLFFMTLSQRKKQNRIQAARESASLQGRK